MSPWTPHSAIVVDAHMNNRTQGQNSIQGLAAGVGASLIWGTYPLWYKPLAHISTYELLANPNNLVACTHDSGHIPDFS
jgi:hypothetical protein